MPTAKRTKTEHTPGRRTDNANTNYANGLMNKENCLQSVSFMQKCVHLEKKIKMLTL